MNLWQQTRETAVMNRWQQTRETAPLTREMIEKAIAAMDARDIARQERIPHCRRSWTRRQRTCMAIHPNDAAWLKAAYEGLMAS